MKTRKHIRKADSQSYTWPIDIEAYDRSLTLTKAERAALSEWDELRKESRYVIHPSIRESLQRLTTPIDDILNFLQVERRDTRADVTRILIQNMYERQTTYWGWTAADWLDILGESGKEFQNRHQASYCRQFLFFTAYLLCEYIEFKIAGFNRYELAVKVLGSEAVDASINRLRTALKSVGYTSLCEGEHFRATLCELMLINRSACLEELTEDTLKAARVRIYPSRQWCVVSISVALEKLGILAHALAQEKKLGFGSSGGAKGVSEEWLSWCERWFSTSTLSPSSRKGTLFGLIIAGRWLAKEHPEITSPEQWNRKLAAAYVASVDRMKVGQFSYRPRKNQTGNPLKSHSKDNLLSAMRTFFRDCQEWEWLPTTFNYNNAFKTPRRVKKLLKPKSKQIDEGMWAKMVWAGLNLTEDDLVNEAHNKGKTYQYPIEMVRAVASVWLFCGLRNDDIRHLRVGCVRCTQNIKPSESDSTAKSISSNETVYLLDVSPGKSEAFTKVVDPSVGKAILAWQQLRPTQPLRSDQQTGDLVHYLFSIRGKRIGLQYLNKWLIPLICWKAGIPLEDVQGKITSHRARHTILTQLSQTMPILQLQTWSGHQSISSLQHYIQPTQAQQIAAYSKSDYFKKNLRTLEVLIDKETIINGAAANGEPWRFYNLGHGYCEYDFYQQCPHRMACAKCEFYTPKGSAKAQILEGKASLLRMLQEIPLTEEERTAVEDGIEAFEKLATKLADVPTPAGPTARELRACE